MGTPLYIDVTPPACLKPEAFPRSSLRIPIFDPDLLEPIFSRPLAIPTRVFGDVASFQRLLHSPRRYP